MYMARATCRHARHAAFSEMTYANCVSLVIRSPSKHDWGTPVLFGWLAKKKKTSRDA